MLPSLSSSLSLFYKLYKHNVVTKLLVIQFMHTVQVNFIPQHSMTSLSKTPRSLSCWVLQRKPHKAKGKQDSPSAAWQRQCSLHFCLEMPLKTCNVPKLKLVLFIQPWLKHFDIKMRVSSNFFWGPGKRWWSMSFHIEKCHQLTVTKKRYRIPTSYTLRNQTLVRVTSVKNFWIWIGYVAGTIHHHDREGREHRGSKSCGLCWLQI